MEKTKTMKGVDERTWMEFKSMAARQNMTAGQFFTTLVKSYEDDVDEFWDDIFNFGKVLSDTEANDIRKITKKMRKERGFRD